MSPLAFVCPFVGSTSSIQSFKRPCLQRRRKRDNPSRCISTYSLRAKLGTETTEVSSSPGRPHRLIGIVGNAKTETKTSTEVDPNPKGGLFGVKAKAYWKSMGVLPLFFAGFGIVALTIKMVKVKGGEWRGGSNGVNKVTVPKSVITSEEEEAELHVFKCGGCGYEMYPARGRESVFFPDSFKCPLCKTPKSEFWDLNDPTDPRNQVEDDDDEDDEDDEGIIESNGNGSTSLTSDEQQVQSTGAEPTTKDTSEPDSS